MKKIDKELFNAVEYGSPKQVASLIRSGANPNAYNEQTGEYVIHVAYDLETLKLLVRAGADVNLKTQDVGRQNDYGLTGLHLACSFGIEDNAEFYLQNGADIFAVTARTNRSIRYCASQQDGRASIHALLDKYDVPKNIFNYRFENELFESALFDDIESVEYLYNHGSVPVIVDDRNKLKRASELPQISTAMKKTLRKIENDFIEKLNNERRCLKALKEEWQNGNYGFYLVDDTHALSTLRSNCGKRVVINFSSKNVECELETAKDGWQTCIVVGERQYPLFGGEEKVYCIRELSSGEVIYENDLCLANKPIHKEIAEILGVRPALEYIEDRLEELKPYEKIEIVPTERTTIVGGMGGK